MIKWILLFFLFVIPVQAQTFTDFIKTAKPIRSLPGWRDFCKNPQHRSVCFSVNQPQRIVFDDVVVQQLVEVNDAVNNLIDPVSDLGQWGKVDVWSYPTEIRGYRGDCEDYVLEKQRRLVEMGYPVNTLAITVVLDEKQLGHAVLTVRTNQGDLVLDNKTNEIKLWHKTGYVFRQQQSFHNTNIWLRIVD